MRQFGYAIVVAVLLLAIYVGSYYAMVERVVIHPSVVSGFERMPLIVFAKYQFGGEISKTIFGPCHAVDKAIRTAYWQGH